jgi:hypothetical protein
MERFESPAGIPSIDPENIRPDRLKDQKDRAIREIRAKNFRIFLGTGRLSRHADYTITNSFHCQAIGNEKPCQR